MMRLLWAELRHGWASWAGLIAVATISALSFSVAIAMVERGLAEGGKVLEASMSFLSMLLMMNIPGAVIVTAAVARLAVDLHRPAYARWQLSGAGPAQTSGIVIVQLACAGLVGGTVGSGLAIPFVPWFLHEVFATDNSWWADAVIAPGAFTVRVVVALTIVVTVLGGLRAALSAGRTPPLAALRDAEPRAKRMGWGRWVLLLVVVFGAGAGLMAPLRAETRETAVSQLPLLPAYLTVIVAAAGPLVYPVVLRAWTALVPARVSTSWYLARHQARFHLGRSTASITPLFVGASLLGGLMTMSATVSAAMAAEGRGGFTMEIMQVMLLIGGPVMLGAIGAAVVIFMSNRTQGAEQALLKASGGSSTTVIASALWQGVIHVVTAALLAGGVIVATAMLSSAVLGRFLPAPPVLDLRAAGLLFALGLLLTIAATALPALGRIREPVAAQLAAV